MSRKTIELREGVFAIVEPIDEDDYEGAGTHSLVSMKVVAVETTKGNIREE